MSKVMGPRTNFRVVVEPRSLGNMGFVRTSDSFLYGHGPEAEKRIAAEYESRCNEIAEQIKRHVDNVGSAFVEFDQGAVCDHCGYPWSEESTSYNGGCCQKDQDTEDARLASSGEQP
jgi:hypothetical protein